MRFRFLHTADLHLDSPMRGLGSRRPELARLFEGATRRAFTALVDRALEERVDFLVIAGDVYDGDWPDHGTGLFFTGQLARLSRAGIPVFMIRGNHDAESQITKSLHLPEGVHLFASRKAQTLDLPDLRVAIHGRSFAERETGENMALAYPAARPGWFNIALLHTSLDGRPDHAPYAPCSLSDLVSKGYDYWALGHVHEAEIVSREPYVVFPGNLQGRHIRETGAKGAVIVEVADGLVESVSPLSFDVARWARMVIACNGSETISDVLKRAEARLRDLAAEAGEMPLVIRLRLEGMTAAHGAMLAMGEDFEAELRNVAGHAGAALHIEKVEIATDIPAIASAPDLGLIDPVAMLASVEGDAALHEALAEIRHDIEAKLPDEVRSALAGMTTDDVLALARDLALARLGAGSAG